MTLYKHHVGDKVYYMHKNRIHCGEVVATHKIDELNYRYLVKESMGSSWMSDIDLYRSLKGILDSLKSIVVY